MPPNQSPPKRVVGYLRVSTEEQATHGLSIENQRAQIERYCRAHGLDLVAVEVDAGLTGTNLNRPGIQSALARLSSGQAEALVILKMDRLCRSLRDWQFLVENFFGDSKPYSLHSLGDSVDTRTASGRLYLNIIISMAQGEAETVKERVSGIVRRSRELGRVLGTVPYGFDVDPTTKTLLVNPEEMRVARTILELHAGGVSLRNIAKKLNEAGIPTKHQTRKRSAGHGWAPSTIRQLINRFSLRDPNPTV